MPSQSRRSMCCEEVSSTGCCLYLITTVIVSVIIYWFTSSHLASQAKLDSLQLDVKLIAGELSELTRNHINLDKTNAEKDISEESTIKCEKSVQVHTYKLHKEIENLKDMVETLRRDGRSTIGKTGRPDYALESLGGQIVSTPDTELYHQNTFFSFLRFHTITNSPRFAIQPSMNPGECFGYKGNKAKIIIKLMGHVDIDAISIAHITKEMSPIGEINSAPKDFTVYGMKYVSDTDPDYLGTFQYQIGGPQLQKFEFCEKCPRSYEYVKFHFTSNHGNSKLTCIYRIQVHGTLIRNAEEKCDTKY